METSRRGLLGGLVGGLISTKLPTNHYSSIPVAAKLKSVSSIENRALKLLLGRIPKVTPIKSIRKNIDRNENFGVIYYLDPSGLANVSL